MKNKILSIIAFGVISFASQAQIRTGNQVEVAITDQNPFLDGSNYTLSDQHRGRGLYFPQTDLTTFVFKTDRLDGLDTFVTAFDGMIVYNTATGVTGNNPATQGIQVNVTPGFYYFYNPNNAGGTSVANGKWIRLSDALQADKGKEFYMPSIVLPTKMDGLSTNTADDVYYNSSDQTFHINLYSMYQKQFGLVGDVVGSSRTALRSNAASSLSTFTSSQLDYFITYFDNTVFDPTSISLTTDGKLQYKVLSTGAVTEKTFMNVVFKVK